MVAEGGANAAFVGVCDMMRVAMFVRFSDKKTECVALMQRKKKSATADSCDVVVCRKAEPRA